VERRQVTGVFSDLVGSTALGSQLDPEDMDRLLQEYRKVCAAVVSRYDGHIAQYLGDGVVAFFGFPVAQEHAAERAVRAGLEIAAAVGRLKRPDGEALQSRVGIATGLVAAGTAGVPGERTVVGDAPNLAARLQSFAEPGCVLVGPATHRLTEAFFEYLFVGEHEVKGYRELIPMWKVVGESTIESRFISARIAGADPILGRERETAFLADAGALRTEMATLSYSPARRALASHGCWKHSSSTCRTRHTGCCARNVPRTTATLCCTRFCNCYVINSTCGGIWPMRKIFSASSACWSASDGPRVRLVC
jgi:class 3 adenylate cyclase